MKRYFQLITHLAFPSDLISMAPGKPGDVVELDAERCKLFGRFLRLREQARDLKEGTVEVRDGGTWFVPLDGSPPVQLISGPAVSAPAPEGTLPPPPAPRSPAAPAAAVPSSSAPTAPAPKE